MLPLLLLFPLGSHVDVLLLLASFLSPQIVAVIYPKFSNQERNGFLMDGTE